MKQIIHGQILDKNNLSVPYLRIELWESGPKDNPVGTSPILTSISRINGSFQLNLQPINQLPDKAILIFRDKAGSDIGSVAITPEILQGKEIYFSSSELIAPKFLEIWPRGYSPIKQIAKKNEPVLTPSPHEGLPFVSSPLDNYFITYSYLDGYWPWNSSTQAVENNDRPLNRKFLLAAQLTHRQRWDLQGYARGELLNSFPLAPGEEATVEILSWDRNIMRREEEISSDMERQVEENRQFKDSREQMRQIEKSKKWRVSADVGLIASVVKFGASTSADGSAQSINKNTVNTIVETSDKASLTIRSQRKTVISSTREFGKEEKVTRKIINSNRCRTVTHHFYEILSNYKLLTALASVRPVIFVKLDPPPFRLDPSSDEWLPITKEDLLVEPCDSNKFLHVVRWLHLYSHLISKGLLDRNLFLGIEALNEFSIFWPCLAKVVSEESDPLIKRSEDVVDSCIVFQKMTTAFDVCDLNNSSTDCRVAAKEVILWDDEVGYVPDSILAVMNNYRSVWKTLTDNLTWFKSHVLKDSSSNIVSIEEAVSNKNEEQLVQVVDTFRNLWEGSEGYYNLPSDVKKELEENQHSSSLIRKISDMLGTVREDGTGSSSTSTIFPDLINNDPDQMRLITEIVRLMRHIERHFLYYCQLIWADQGADDRLLEFDNIQLPGTEPPIYLADVINNDLLGFYGHYAVFPFSGEIISPRLKGHSSQNNTSTPTIGLAEAIEAFEKEIVAEEDLEEKAAESWSVLPTNGIVVEPQLGEFTACEPFIQKHREHDLELKHQEVEKIKLENQRRQAKINHCELDNPECCPSIKHGFLTKLLCYLRDKIG